MKRFLFVIALAVSVLTASAQSYRGFIDVFGGYGVAGTKDFTNGNHTFKDVRADWAFGLRTSHGCQVLPYLYTGLGFGGYMVLNGAEAYDEYRGSYRDIQLDALNIPIFADFRYDLNIQSKVTPFVSVKLGYQIAVDLLSEESAGEGSGAYLYSKPESGFYFEPMIGMRIRTGSHSGFNLGISYNPTLRRKLSISDKYENENYATEVGKQTCGALMLNLGFDF